MTRHSLRQLVKPFALIAMLTLALPGATEAQAPNKDRSPLIRPLNSEAWRDQAYGVSLRLPAMLRVQPQPPKGVLLNAADENKLYTLRVLIRELPKPVSLDVAMEGAAETVFRQQSATRSYEDPRKETVNGRVAGVLKYQSPRTDGSGAADYVGYAMMPIDAVKIVVLEVRGDFERHRQINQLFEATFATMSVADPKEINARRREQLLLTREWRRGLIKKKGVAKTLRESLIPEQWFRIIENGRDVGYVLITQEHTEVQFKRGVAVEVQTRIATKGHFVDTLDQYFLADDDSTELWSQRATQRPAITVLTPKKERANLHPTIVKTGIRERHQLKVTIDDPTGSKSYRFLRPDTAYLSQVEMWLLPQVLPINTPGTYGSYAFNAEERSITFRTDQIVPTLSGFTLITRVAPNAPAVKATYDRNRQLIEKRAGNNTKIVRTNRATIEQLWRGRF